MRKLLTIVAVFFAVHANLWSYDLPVKLDTRYHDADGDLLADTPTDPSGWIDPPTLIFSYAPHEDPDIYRKDWQDFLTYLSRVTGKKVIYFPYQTNRAQLEAMRYGRLHVSGFNTGSVPDAVNYAGFHPVAVMADANGTYGYRMEILTYKGSGIETIDALRGKTLTLTAPSSNSGNRAPRYLLERDFHLVAGEDYDVRYSGSHANSLKGLIRHRYRIVAVASSVKHRMIARGSLDASQLVTLYRSDIFPTTAYGYVYNLKPSLANAVRRAFLTFPWRTENGKPTSIKRAFSRHDTFIPADYKTMWREVRKIVHASASSGK